MAAIAAASGLRPVDPAKCIIVKMLPAATTITAGEAVYLSAAGTVAIADKDTYAAATVFGIALQTAANTADAIDVCVLGELTGYSSLTAGADVWVYDDGSLTISFDGSDNTANGDLAEGDFPGFVGICTSTTNIFVRPEKPLLALAA